MDRLRSNPASPWRAWPLLIVGILVGSLALTPAVTAAGKFLTKKKAVKLFEEEKDAAAQYALFEEEADAAASYVRVAFAGDPDVAFTGPSGVGGGTDGTVLQTQVTAPGPGFLVVGASSKVSANGSDDSLSCAVRFDGVTYAPSMRDLGITGGDTEICATEATQAVTAGAHTVELRAFGAGGSTVQGEWGPASMHVLFVALGATGGLGV